MSVASEIFPVVDASQLDAITDEHVQFFRRNGLLVVRNLVRADELAALQRETQVFVDRGVADRADDPWRADLQYKTHGPSGRRVPFRCEYVVDKAPACRALLGHPFVLRSIEKLQSRDFLATWDSMVYKLGGAGVEISWHRDSGNIYRSLPPEDATVAAINVDFYLDGSNMSNCLWGIPGSNLWSEDAANARLAALQEGGFHTDSECVPIVMQPGDVIFHSILAIHGSPAAQSELRRVLYYEFRPIALERQIGPHNDAYIPAKQRVLQACLKHRAASPVARGETPFVYRAEGAQPVAEPDLPLPSYRFAHGDYWRV